MTKNNLLILHRLLGELEIYLARLSIPPNWDSEEAQAVKDIQQTIEKLIQEKKYF